MSFMECFVAFCFWFFSTIVFTNECFKQLVALDFQISVVLEIRMLGPCELCKIWVDDVNDEEPRGFVELVVIDILYSKVITLEFVFNLKIWRMIIEEGSQCPSGSFELELCQTLVVTKKMLNYDNNFLLVRTSRL
jgi:hypothetical protein